VPFSASLGQAIQQDVRVASRDLSRQERVRAAYDTIAGDYDRHIGDELDSKPLDRKLLETITELVKEGTIADVGCGPGHVTRFLAALHDDVIGIDLSPQMIAVAKDRAPNLRFLVASMLDLPVASGQWAGAVALYSIIHFDESERADAWRQLAKAVRPDGWLLVAFHVDSAEADVGGAKHVSEWFGHAVDLDGHFLDPASVTSEIEGAGFSVVARLERIPNRAIEYPSRRCYVLAQRCADGLSKDG
jgi:SAM-dependent methyltransferase